MFFVKLRSLFRDNNNFIQNLRAETFNDFRSRRTHLKISREEALFEILANRCCII